MKDTLTRYAFALDRHDPAALADVLTEDADWTFTVAGAPGPGPITGRARILDFVTAAWRAETGQRRHHLVNVLVDRADATSAVVRAYLLLTATTSLVTTGVYTFTLRRADDDTWRIATLVLDMDG